MIESISCLSFFGMGAIFGLVLGAYAYKKCMDQWSKCHKEVLKMVKREADE